MSSRAPRHLVRRPVLLTCSLVALVVVVLVAVLASRSAAPGTVAVSPLVGRQAPALAGADIVTGRSVSLARLRDRFVIVNFFASWCAPCTTEAPQLVAYLYAHRHSDVSVLGVVFDDSASNAAAFLRRVGATWPAIVDPDGTFSVEYGVARPPQSFIVAPGGRVIASVIGGVTEAELDTLIAAGPAAS